jgi:mono/diheme cytochrome c family protein
MFQYFDRCITRIAPAMASCLLLSLMASCGGGSSGSEKDSGVTKTYLTIESVDADSDALSYQWRATAGTIENRNSKETVWTMPDGPGLHFAYVTVSDGKGGYYEQQYAVSSDTLNTTAPRRAPVDNPAPTVGSGDEFVGGTARLRLYAADTQSTPSNLTRRQVFLPGIQVEILKQGTTEQVFIGTTDLGGELSVPKLHDGQALDVKCTTPQGVLLTGCNLTASTDAQSVDWAVTPPAGRNLILFGHVGLADGGVCGMQSEYFGMRASATVQLLQQDGTVLSPPIQVNRFGDYELDAAVVVNAQLKLKVQCESHTATLTVPQPQAGYAHATPVEMPAYTVPNSRPHLLKMVATGPDGNVRGKMIVPLSTDYSNNLPGHDHFLTYKGRDTRLSACNYYKSFGAVKDCDAQGNMISPITLDDWKRQHKLTPYNNGNPEVAATYINQRDLNLVRRMIATQSSSNDVAFYVCNSPGPVGRSQAEADQVIEVGLADQKRVACVAMEHSVTPGRSGGVPFTKFLTFGPDGSLIPSVNLDSRGEKYMPGACVACHGGTQYNGRFPEKGNPSPDLKANFLAFDTGNYIFSTQASLTEPMQAASLRRLNDLVLATGPATATTNLIQGWYALNPGSLDKSYVPPAWDFDPATKGISATRADAARFYREVVGTSCRTCHAAMRDAYDWDSGNGTFPWLTNYRGSARICGGSPDVHINATMPNALISRDRLQDRLREDPTLAALVQKFLGCTEPAADPLYPKR